MNATPRRSLGSTRPGLEHLRFLWARAIVMQNRRMPVYKVSRAIDALESAAMHSGLRVPWVAPHRSREHLIGLWCELVKRWPLGRLSHIGRPEKMPAEIKDSTLDWLGSGLAKVRGTTTKLEIHDGYFGIWHNGNGLVVPITELIQFLHHTGAIT